MDRKTESNYFPLFIDMSGRRVRMIGAGAIALRRTKGLLDFGAIVTVTAPDIRKEFYELQETCGSNVLILEKKAFETGSISRGHADFVLAATDDREVELAVYRECKEKKIPVNIASDQTLCDFQFPALIRQDGLVIGVNSGGGDHRKVRRASAGIREYLSSTERQTADG